MSKIIYTSIIYFLIFTSSSFANYRMSPVKLKIEKDQRVTSMNFYNDTDHGTTFQVSVLKKHYNEDETERYELSNELMVTPMLFNIKPKGSQLIRVAARAVAKPTKKYDDYRISIKELFQGELQNGVVSMISEFRIPVQIK